MQHFDSNGWPIIDRGKYIGLLDDNDNRPVFITPHNQELIKQQRVMMNVFMDYLNKERE